MLPKAKVKSSCSCRDIKPRSSCLNFCGEDNISVSSLQQRMRNIENENEYESEHEKDLLQWMQSYDDVSPLYKCKDKKCHWKKRFNVRGQMIDILEKEVINMDSQVEYLEREYDKVCEDYEKLIKKYNALKKTLNE